MSFPRKRESSGPRRARADSIPRSARRATNSDSAVASWMLAFREHDEEARRQGDHMAGMSKGARWDFWIDRGGTFTDVIGCDPAGRLQVRKLLSESPAYTDAAVQAIRDLARASRPARLSRRMRSASSRWAPRSPPTRSLERRGERTLAGRDESGFRDALEIGYQARPKIFARNIIKPEQLYSGVVEVDERVLADGTVEAAPGPRSRARGSRPHAKSRGLRRRRDRIHARLSLS